MLIDLKSQRKFRCPLSMKDESFESKLKPFKIKKINNNYEIEYLQSNQIDDIFKYFVTYTENEIESDVKNN